MDLLLGKIVVLHQITEELIEKINTMIIEIVIIDLKDCNKNNKVIIEAEAVMNLEMIGTITDHILEKVILIHLEALLMIIIKEIVIDLFEAMVIETKTMLLDIVMSNVIHLIGRRRLEMNFGNHQEEVLEDHVYLEVVVAVNLNEEVIMSKKVHQGRIEVDLQSWMIVVRGKMILILEFQIPTIVLYYFFVNDHKN